MSASQILQYLYSLDTSSPGFPRFIYGLIRHDEEEQYLSSLQGSELARLVNFLDKVSTFLLEFHLITTPNFTGSRCHPHRRRHFTTMFAQTASHLWRQHDLTFLIHHIR